MKDSIIPSSQRIAISLAPKKISSRVSAAARSGFFRRLEELTTGQLIIEEGENSTCFGANGPDEELRATLRVHDARFYSDIAFGGSLGAGEAYMAGYWSSDDLTMLMRIFILNRHILTRVEKGVARLSAPVYNLMHRMRKNTRAGSRKNITAHYDLGNDFYRLFLDDTMTYSCGIFRTPQSSLRDASLEKYDRICRKLMLSPEDHLLEIGTGWGGFALYAAQNFGCRVTTTTISDEQYAYVEKLIRKEGVENRIELLKDDYRDLRGRYDKLVSIEMIEAVGHHFLETFFRCCGSLLKDTGMMLLQAITIDDRVYDDHVRSVDFIKRYIFPGSCIPSVTAMTKAVKSATDMKLFHLEDITPHYTLTLRHWRESFFSNIKKVREQGFSEEFIKMWEYYFCYCESGFAERYIGDVQILFTKPLSRRPSIIPPLEGRDNY